MEVYTSYVYCTCWIGHWQRVTTSTYTPCRRAYVRAVEPFRLIDQLLLTIKILRGLVVYSYNRRVAGSHVLCAQVQRTTRSLRRANWLQDAGGILRRSWR